MPEISYFEQSLLESSNPHAFVEGWHIQFSVTRRELASADAEDIERWLAGLRDAFYNLVRSHRHEAYDHYRQPRPAPRERPRPPAYDFESTAEDLPDPVTIEGREEASPRVQTVRILEPPDNGGRP